MSIGLEKSALGALFQQLDLIYNKTKRNSQADVS
jgi:hypothetical protein